MLVSLGTSGQKSKKCESNFGFIVQVFKKVGMPWIWLIGPRWPPFAPICYSKTCKKHYKTLGFCNFETKCEFHWGLLVRKVKSVSFIRV